MSAVAENIQTEMPAPILFTDSAAAKVADLIAEEGNPDLKLRVFVQGGGCSGFQYGFTFDEITNEDDTTMTKNGVSLLIDAMSYQYLVGAEIDYKEDLQGAQFVIKNPNAHHHLRLRVVLLDLSHGLAGREPRISSAGVDGTQHAGASGARDAFEACRFRAATPCGPARRRRRPRPAMAAGPASQTMQPCTSGSGDCRRCISAVLKRAAAADHQGPASVRMAPAGRGAGQRP